MPDVKRYLDDMQISKPISLSTVLMLSIYYECKHNIIVLASAVHILKLERYREDQHGPCARMTRKFVKRSIFFSILWSCYRISRCQTSLSRVHQSVLMKLDPPAHAITIPAQRIGELSLKCTFWNSPRPHAANNCHIKGHWSQTPIFMFLKSPPRSVRDVATRSMSF